MEEHRKKLRRELVKVVGIKTITDVGAPSECTLCDVSETGAKIMSSAIASIPAEFCLLLDGNLKRWCQIAWRNKTHAGVKFIEKPMIPDRSTGTVRYAPVSTIAVESSRRRIRQR